MHRIRRRRTLVLASTAMSLAVLAAGCSSGSDTNAAATPSAAAESATFGAGCAGIPPSGAGSLSAMAAAPVAMAASGNPSLTTFAGAVKDAGLFDTLENAKDITVFAPTNDAFAGNKSEALMMAKEKPTTELPVVLKYHVVQGRLSPSELAGTHKTLEGQDLTVTGSNNEFAVNGSAKVVCGNIQTANATVYVIDGVLLPPKK